MTSETHPAVVICGLALLAQKEGRLSEASVRGISEIGANIDRLTSGEWTNILKKMDPNVRRELANLRHIPAEERLEYAQILMKVAGPDRGFNAGDWDVTQSYIDLLHAADKTLDTIEAVVAKLELLT